MGGTLIWLIAGDPRRGGARRGRAAGLNVPNFLGKLDPWFDSGVMPDWLRLKVCRLPQFAAALKGSPTLSFLVAWRSMVAYCGSRPATLAVKPSDLPGPRGDVCWAPLETLSFLNGPAD